MTTLREAAQQALEALEQFAETKLVRTSGVINDLRTALAEPEQEPTIKWDASAPVLLNNGRLRQYPDGSIGVGTPTPRKPLTDEEIALIVGECAASAHRHDDFSFARAIERAHGIGGTSDD
jgi:hypothetical protein